MTELIFLKLGGSLITDKTRPYTPRLEILSALARQIAAFRQACPDRVLVLGHGSGSFGHVAARKYHTRAGLPALGAGENGGVTQREQTYWRGFAEVWFQASALNRFLMEALRQADVPAVALAPVSAVVAQDGRVAHWNLQPLRMALAAGLVPVVYGDVVFDEVRGGTILSTEDLFEYLAQQLRPKRILLAGLEGAVWADFPLRQQRVEKITPASFAQIQAGVGKSHGADVTGGMESKVRQMLALVTEIPGMTAQIFSGEVEGNIERALYGEVLGTVIEAS
ncbi:MAG: uridylate kinase [Anaerolineae bacterium]|nr:MAG: uridylate kinase [Anaerolineae bacterium]